MHHLRRLADQERDHDHVWRTHTRQANRAHGCQSRGRLTSSTGFHNETMCADGPEDRKVNGRGRLPGGRRCAVGIATDLHYIFL
jgi:hypothetical protein